MEQQPTQDGMRYHGPERRHGAERRQVHDRRDMIRFELKDDRRSGKDRRQQDGWGKPLSRY